MDKNGTHVTFKDSVPLSGTIRYCSINSHTLTVSRRDDIEIESRGKKRRFNLRDYDTDNAPPTLDSKEATTSNDTLASSTHANAAAMPSTLKQTP